MTSKILITGISGFIGRNVLRQLVQSHDSITAIIRPGTKHQRIEEFVNKVEFAEIDLTDISTLKEYLDENSFEIIIHIGALRGGRNFTKEDYFNANVNATEQFIINAIANNSDFIYFSSVGVFGTSPEILPAHNRSPQKAENYYYFTKKQSESLIQKYILQNLKACIIRPSVTYGIEDKGFPYKLIAMVDKKILFLPNKSVKIHLTNVDLLAQGVLKLIEKGFDSGSAYIIADPDLVELHQLVDFISQELTQKDFGHLHRLDIRIFEFFIRLFKMIKKYNMVSSLEFLSKSWYYDVTLSYKDLGLKSVPTTSGFKKVIDWYKSTK